jgi:hypothetical protein
VIAKECEELTGKARLEMDYLPVARQYPFRMSSRETDDLESLRKLWILREYAEYLCLFSTQHVWGPSGVDTPQTRNNGDFVIARRQPQ